MVVVVVVVAVDVAITVVLFGYLDIVYVLNMATQRTCITIGPITALKGAIERLPVTVRLHMTSQMIMPLEGL